MFHHDEPFMLLNFLKSWKYSKYTQNLTLFASDAVTPSCKSHKSVKPEDTSSHILGTHKLLFPTVSNKEKNTKIHTENIQISLVLPRIGKSIDYLSRSADERK